MRRGLVAVAVVIAPAVVTVIAGRVHRLAPCRVGKVQRAQADAARGKQRHGAEDEDGVDKPAHRRAV